jgi:FkbM family methyltransferase
MTDIVLNAGRVLSPGVSLVEKLAVLGLKLSSAALQPTHFKGYGRIAAILRKASPRRHMILELDSDCSFRFPFGDAYWSRLAASSVSYEPEMLALFRLIRDEDYAFVDCGANFGYWSVLVSEAALGAHRAIAIEASGRNVSELAANARLNHDRFEVLHVAVSEQDGGMVTLGGPTHEGLAIVDPATAAPGAETVACRSLDGVLRDTPWLNATDRIVLKLDVEGVEEAALRGAGAMLGRDTLLIYEEQGSDSHHGNTRHVSGALGMSVFTYRDGRFVEAADPLAAMAAMKTNARRGYNVVATRSPAWLAVLRGQAA